jgi:hypothetical protein
VREILLKPDFNLLSEYGYSNFAIFNRHPKKEVPPGTLEINYLNNIPAADVGEESLKAIQTLKTVCKFYKIGRLTDTLIYISLDQADWFHGNLQVQYERYWRNSKKKEIADFLMGLEAQEDIKIQIKKGRKVIASLKTPEYVNYIKGLIYQKINSTSEVPLSDLNDRSSYLIEELRELAFQKIKNPSRLDNKFRTIFIIQLHKFIAEQTIYKSDEFSYTLIQRNLIYEIGLNLQIFPPNIENSESDYIKQLYQENVALFEKMQKGGRIVF